MPVWRGPVAAPRGLVTGSVLARRGHLGHWECALWTGSSPVRGLQGQDGQGQGDQEEEEDDPAALASQLAKHGVNLQLAASRGKAASGAGKRRGGASGGGTGAKRSRGGGTSGGGRGRGRGSTHGAAGKALARQYPGP